MVLSRAFSAAVQRINTQRPPSVNMGFSDLIQQAVGSTGSGVTNQMDAYASVPWLFSVVQRISTGVSGQRWALMEGDEDQQQRIERHPLLDLWNKPNPFYTRLEFIETFQQHLDLTGEAWWVLLRNVSGEVTEMWPVRPDRMQPVRHSTDFISGYVYTIGDTKIPLELDDVVFLRLPNPLDPYRGLGPVQSLMVDIASETMSAQWVANFFRNSAEPGGLIQYDSALQDSEFEKLRDRWQMQHRGVANAHRVAIIEKGKWVDRKMSQRDMQFVDLRKMNRDLILGAFGISGAMVGITESVNRANAEAAEVTFGRWVVKPRLERIRDALNQQLLPLFDAQNLSFEYDDPVPENRDASLNEAERAYKAKILTRNEARAVLGYPETTDGGDEFAAETEPAVAEATEPEETEPEETRLAKVADPNDILPNPQQVAEGNIYRGWVTRLAKEADALAEYLQQFDVPRPIAASITETLAKIEAGDVDGFDWDWFTRYADDTEKELRAAFVVSVGDELAAEVGASEGQRLASQYARRRTAEILAADGDAAMSRSTRRQLSRMIGRSIREGEALSTLQTRIRSHYAFSPQRATTIARTESATAYGRGRRQLAMERGEDEAKWVTQGDDRVDFGLANGPCLVNEGEGWIKVADGFPSGHSAPPTHPNCRCTAIYRTSPPPEDFDLGEDVEIDALEGLEDDVDAAIADAGNLDAPMLTSVTLVETRCPECDRRLPANNIRGEADVYCRHCGTVTTFDSASSLTISNIPE